MADHALFIGWGEIISGREQQAARVFGETMAYFGRLQQQGEIASVEPYFMEPHGGDLNGFFLLRGEIDALSRVRASEEFGRVILRATMVVQRMGVVAATTGQELERQLGSIPGLTLQRVGSVFWPYLAADAAPLRSLGDMKARPAAAFGPVFHKLLDGGIYLAPSAFEVGFLSAAHTTAHVTQLSTALRGALLT